MRHVAAPVRLRLRPLEALPATLLSIPPVRVPAAAHVVAALDLLDDAAAVRAAAAVPLFPCLHLVEVAAHVLLPGRSGPAVRRAALLAPAPVFLHRRRRGRAVAAVPGLEAAAAECRTADARDAGGLGWQREPSAAARAAVHLGVICSAVL